MIDLALSFEILCFAVVLVAFVAVGLFSIGSWLAIAIYQLFTD